MKELFDILCAKDLKASRRQFLRYGVVYPLALLIVPFTLLAILQWLIM